MQLEDVTEGELVVPGKLAKLLRTDAKEIAWTIGLDESVLKRHSSRHTPDTQRRLRELVDALLILTPRFGSPLMAYAWYRSVPRAGFAGWTAMQLAQAGKVEELHLYLGAVDSGVFA
ncbi:hypothetical protein [Sneathiella aquimaris]|uniref:hypothetical protein n=1 Tax=Sneathiella aquimaris TaxID=2599305 RepID=UPI00146B413A|nr:hypothetical protein [Sneathiella aquimaris]